MSAMVLAAAPEFPIYMDPDRVGTFNQPDARPKRLVFPIYMDPDRVGT